MEEELNNESSTIWSQSYHHGQSVPPLFEAEIYGKIFMLYY